MSYVSPDYIEKLMQEHNARFWVIRSADGKNVVNRNDSDITVLESIDKLRAAISSLSGTFQISVRTRAGAELQNSGDKKGGIFDLTIKLNSGNAGIGSPNSSTSGLGLDTFIGLMQQNAALQMDLLRKEFEYKQKKEEPSFIEKFLDNPQIGAALAGVLQKFAGGSPAGTIQVSAPEGETLTVYQEAAGLFAAVDPEAPEILLKLARYVSKNPAMWQGFKDTLKTQNII